jgi:hypothetical protein
VGENVWIDNLDTITIGNNCCLSQGAFLLCGSHDYTATTFDLMTKPIILEDGAWVGAKATVCPGVTMGSHSVLAAGSTATHNLDAYGIYQGNPAIKNRSDNKGPEPEGVTVATVCGNTYAFVSMERSGGVVAYDVTDPLAPKFSAYANNRTAPANANTNDTGPEGIIFISAAESPNGQNLLLLANEISSSVSVFQVNCSPVQPVDLLRFDGRLQANDVVLNWQIASEDDLKYFEIQHSTDGRNYNTLGKSQPNGNNYQYVHANVADGKHYYRILTLEKDGKQKQSRVVVLVKGQAGTFIVGLQQNPVNSFVTTKLYSNKSQWANAVITDIAGRIIATSKTQIAKGEQQLKMAAPVANGVYFITITTEDGLRETLRFVK